MLPEVYKITVRGTQVLALGDNGVVYVIEHHGSRISTIAVNSHAFLLKEQPLFTKNDDPYMRILNRDTDVFFDPFSTDRYFVLSIGALSSSPRNTASRPVYHVFVSEFRGSEYVATHGYGQLPALGCPAEPGAEVSPRDYVTLTEECNEYGVVTLVWVQDLDMSKSVYITFDTVTNQFSTERYLTGPYEYSIHRCWNQQIFMPKECRRGALKIEVANVDAGSDLEVRGVRGRPSKTYAVDHLSHRFQSSYDRESMEFSATIWCDGDFMVYYFPETTHCFVWAFK